MTYNERAELDSRTDDVMKFIEEIARPLMVYRFASRMVDVPKDHARRGALKRATRAAEEIREAALELVREMPVVPDIEVHDRTAVCTRCGWPVADAERRSFGVDSNGHTQWVDPECMPTGAVGPLANEQREESK